MKVQEIVFMQGEEANEAMLILSKEGETGLLDHLADNHYTGNVKKEDIKTILFIEDITYPKDTIFKCNDFVLSYNKDLGYCGLVKILK